jgi:flagellar basal-body rod modification protein FlgD
MITTNSTTQTATILPTGTKTGISSLGQADFIKMMTAQLQNQDPTDPVDQKDMLAQMAQFSSLSGITDINTTLKDISSKLDTVISSQSAAKSLNSSTSS